MTRNPELALYPQVSEWLARSLRGRHPRAEVAAFDTHSTDLATFLRKEGPHSFFSDCDAYEIQVDVTGVVKTQKAISLAFVECKIGPVTLRDVGQLLGYSLVACPEWSFLVTKGPFGMPSQSAGHVREAGRPAIRTQSIHEVSYVERRPLRTRSSDRSSARAPLLNPRLRQARR